MKTQHKKLALTGVLLALALIIGTIESVIPPIIPALPFVRIGLSNVVITFTLITLGVFPALVITISKAVLVPLFVGNPMMIAYSIGGAILSFIASFLLIQLKKLSLPTIGSVSSILHNVGQLIVASLIMQSTHVFGFFPYLFITGFISGILTGILTLLLVKYLPKNILEIT